jgi:GAF domain-containing protein
MLNQVRNFFAPPVFSEDEDKTRKAKYANAIMIAFLGVVILFETLIRVSENYTELSYIDLIMVGLMVLFISGLVLLRKGYVQLTSVLLVVLVWIASNGLAATGFGAKDASYLTNFAIILMAGLLLGWPAAAGVTLLSTISGFALAYAEQTELIVVPFYPILSFARDVTVVFILNGVLILLLITGLENALKRSRGHLKELETANESLSVTQTELEARTSDLLAANTQLENRTKKLRAVAEVTRTATALRDFDQLLSSIPTIISSELGYYHVAIFLLDEQKQYAILRSANTEGGWQMISRGYRLPVGQLGIVNSVAQTGQPRIAFNSAHDKVFFNNPELTESQSELALPLKSGNEVMGVLDIQSVQANDFAETDIATLSILADQVGIALQNARLFEESQRALRESNIESLQASKRAWKGYAESLQTKGYRYDGIRSEPLKEARGSSTEHDGLLIPVQLRGQTIGRLKLNTSDHSHQWTDDELVLVKATAERVALALESARLLEEAQRRATRESFLSEVATKLSTSFQLDSILRDTVEELGQTLINSTITFQLVRPTESGEAMEEKSNGNPAHKSGPGANNG